MKEESGLWRGERWKRMRLCKGMGRVCSGRARSYRRRFRRRMFGEWGKKAGAWGRGVQGSNEKVEQNREEDKEGKKW